METLKADEQCCDACCDSLGCDSMAITQSGAVVLACDRCKGILDKIFDEIGEPDKLTDLVVKQPDPQAEECPACGGDFSGIMSTITHDNHVMGVCEDCAGIVTELMQELGRGMVQAVREFREEEKKAATKVAGKKKK